MDKIYSYVNKSSQYGEITSTLSLYENRVELDFYIVDPNGTVSTRQNIWSIKNIAKVEFCKGPKEVVLKIDEQSILILPATSDIEENLGRFVQLLKERL